MQIKFAFEELPLLTVNGFAAGLVDGTANITVCGNGEWFVREIFLDGVKPRKENGITTHDHKPVEVEQGGANDDLYLTIWGELMDGSYKESVQTAVEQAMLEDGPIPHPGYSEHSTLNRAMQGV